MRSPYPVGHEKATTLDARWPDIRFDTVGDTGHPVSGTSARIVRSITSNVLASPTPGSCEDDSRPRSGWIRFRQNLIARDPWRAPRRCGTGCYEVV
jgi:hypothetical protein